MTSNSYAYFSVAYLINWYRETGIPVIADADYQVAHLEDYIEWLYKQNSEATHRTNTRETK